MEPIPTAFDFWFMDLMAEDAAIEADQRDHEAWAATLPPVDCYAAEADEVDASEWRYA